MFLFTHNITVRLFNNNTVIKLQVVILPNMYALNYTFQPQILAK